MKELVAERWGARYALKTPPHLTIQPPFEWPRERFPALQECLLAFAKQESVFEIELKNFGAFPPSVLFVNCLKNKVLEALFHGLIARLEIDLEFVDPRNKKPFHPHITIAHRDLDEWDFPAAWHFFREKTFEKRFTAQEISLLESVEGKWVIRETFPFSG